MPVYKVFVRMGGMTGNYGFMRSNGYRLYPSFVGIKTKYECGTRNLNLRHDAEGGACGDMDVDSSRVFAMLPYTKFETSQNTPYRPHENEA